MAARMFVFFILGLGLLIAGLVFQVFQPALGLWTWAGYGLGAACLALYVVVNRRELAEMFTRRAARKGAAGLVMSVAFVGILTVVGLISEKHHWRKDLTESKSHSIALQSRQQLEKLDRDTLNLTVYVFHRGDSDLRSKQALVDLLDTYRYYSGRFKYELVDIDRNPLLAMQLGITSTSSIILTYGEKQEKIYSDQEAKLTSAIASLLKGGGAGMKGAVYFVTGHGEPSLEQAESYSLSQAKEAVEAQLGPVRELLLATGREVPDSCEILVVPGPEKDLLSLELASIRRYIARGGPVLFMLEPFVGEDLIAFLGQFGVQVGDDLVIDVLRGAVSSPFAFLANNYPQHDITRFFEVGTVFDLVRSVRKAESPPVGATVDEIIKTSEKGHAERDRALLQNDFGAVYQKAVDQGQEVPFAVAVELSAGFRFEGDSAATAVDSARADSTGAAASKPAFPGSRLVVIGDRDFAIDGYFGQLGNSDLLLNVLRWLHGQTEEITITPKETANNPIMLQRSQLFTMGFVSVLGLPALVLFTGIFVWVRRRSKR